MADPADDLPALAALLSGYAGAEAGRHRLVWTLDGRLARLVATTSEPMIGQMRLAWWDEALTDESGAKGRGEPLVDAMSAAGLLPPPGLSPWLDGWEALIGDVDLRAYAMGRGGGLFRALAGRDDIPDWLACAGAAWALWDLSGHTGDGRRAEAAITLGSEFLIDARCDWPPEWRPLRIAYQLARHDIGRSRRAPPALTPALYLRLMRIALTGG